MQTVIGPRFPTARIFAHVGRFLSVGLLVASTMIGDAAPEAHPTVLVKAEFNAKSEPILLANPLKRPKAKVPHITYHRKDFYYC